MTFWKNNEEEFRDIPDEVNGDIVEERLPGPTRPATNLPADRGVVDGLAPGEMTEMFLENVKSAGIATEEDDDDYSEVLSDASLRLEQGNLYKMIMNHDLFQGMDADPKAIRNVQREIRKFAKERMEIMLGMRQEKLAQAYAEHNAALASPFNDLEVLVLKKLAATATKGASEKPEANQKAAVIAKKEGLTPISGSTKAKPAPVTQKQLPSKPAAPVVRQPAPKATAILDEEYKPLEKPISEMTTDELIERNKQAAARQERAGRAKSATAVPHPTYEQTEFMLMQQAANVAPGVSAIINLMNQQKK